MSAEERAGRAVETASVQQRFLGSVVWTGGSRVLLIVLGLGVTATLARLLSPADYGLMGMAMVFIGLVNQARDLGIGQAVVQRRSLPAEVQAQAFTLTILVSIGLFTLAWVAAPIVAYIFREPRLVLLVRVLAVTFPISALQVLPLALLRRNLRLRGEAISRTTATLVDSVLANGAGTLAVGEIETATLTYVIDSDDLGNDIVNIATADSDQTGEATDTNTVPVPNPGLSIVKSNNSDATAAGEAHARPIHVQGPVHRRRLYPHADHAESRTGGKQVRIAHDHEQVVAIARQPARVAQLEPHGGLLPTRRGFPVGPLHRARGTTARQAGCRDESGGEEDAARG